jgi:hypothetical protein
MARRLLQGFRKAVRQRAEFRSTMWSANALLGKKLLIAAQGSVVVHTDSGSSAIRTTNGWLPITSE